MNTKKQSWKDQRINAINRLSRSKGWKFDDANPYFDEWIRVLNSKATSKKEYINEQRNAVTS